MLDQAFDAAKRGRAVPELGFCRDGDRGLRPALDADRKHAAEAARQLPRCDIVTGVTGQAWIVYARNFCVPAEMFGQELSGSAGALDPQIERAHATHQKPRLKRAEGSAGAGPAVDEAFPEIIALRCGEAAARMQILIGDLLAFARITTEGRKFEPVDLKAVVGEVVEDLEARLIDTGGRVEIGKLPTIDADPVQIRQLFQNLIGNALKFNKPGEVPLVRVRAANGNGRSRSKNRDAAVPVGECEITVKDTGIGFEPEYGEQIFEIFKRLHGRSEYEGTGVGLAICRRIVERHGGTIAVNAKPGKGATFYIRLPIRHQQEVPIDEAA